MTGVKNNMNAKQDARAKAAIEAIEKQIDENLRRVYEQDATQEVPDRFLDLLQQLRKQDSQE